jgi:hypothetical protein
VVIGVGLTAILLSGCAYKVTLNSNPQGAVVELPSGDAVTTPASVQLKWAPFNHQHLVVYAPGYRTMVVDLRRSEIRLSRYMTDALFRPKTWSGAPRGEVDVVMIPLHGRSGTWSGDEISGR